MGIVDTIRNAAEELVNKGEDKPQAPVAPVAPTPEVQTVDRSAYNCPKCGGEGLVVDNFEEGNFVRCPQCGGTGRV